MNDASIVREVKAKLLGDAGAYIVPPRIAWNKIIRNRRRVIAYLFSKCDWNIKRISIATGVSRTTIYRDLEGLR